MTKPNQPSYKFSTPFCVNGTRAQIPATGTTPGRATLDKGFPTETQLPMSQGGVAPNRTDFNGMFWALSAFAWWQQSGGQFSWDEGLNYAVPALVYHSGKLWWCLAENGADNVAGVVEPGTDEDVWQELLRSLADQMGGGGGGDITNIFGGNPVGAIIMYHGTTAPLGYLVCDGSDFSASQYPNLYAALGMAKTPDLRGCFIRGYDPGGIHDPDGGNRNVGSYQADALQNITGSAVIYAHDASSTASGCFYLDEYNKDGSPSFGDWNNPALKFDASRVARTANETRPKNISLLFCVKHD
jgi:hypothetical protein